MQVVLTAVWWRWGWRKKTERQRRRERQRWSISYALHMLKYGNSSKHKKSIIYYSRLLFTQSKTFQKNMNRKKPIKVYIEYSPLACKNECVKKKKNMHRHCIVAKIRRSDFSRPGLNFVHLHPCLSVKW